MVSQRPIPKTSATKYGEKPILRIFLTGQLIVMDLQGIPLNICLRVINLNKVVQKKLTLQ